MRQSASFLILAIVLGAFGALNGCGSGGATIACCETSSGSGTPPPPTSPPPPSPPPAPPPAVSRFALQTDTADTIGGTPFALTVTAVDATGNPIANFSGMLQFSSTDPHAVLPETSTMNTVTETFIVSLSSPGTQTISVATTTHDLTGTSDAIYVTARPALVITTAVLPEGSVGVPYGPSTLVYQKCVWSPVYGWHYSCVTTTGADCQTLPPCGRSQNNLKPCCRTEAGHIGVPLSAAGAVNGVKWTVVGAANSSVPPGLHIDGDSLTGTPASDSAGNYEVLLTATDGGLPTAETSVSLPLDIQK